MFSVIAPTGGFGNHLRLLLILSKEFEWNFCETSSIEDKISFIEKNVYPNSRSWQNWLETEWLFRNNFNKILLFSHDLKSILNNENKSILLTSSPELCLYAYLKFNSNLNNRSFKQFKEEITTHNKFIQNTLSKNKEKFLTLNSDILFTEQLNKEFYDACIDFFNIENQFENAQHVHKIWFNLHLKAEKEIGIFLKNFYTKSKN